jgi:hypothetical protein
MSGEEIQLDRYAKFRKLGLFQEFVVKGGKLSEAVAERAAVSALWSLQLIRVPFLLLACPSCGLRTIHLVHCTRPSRRISSPPHTPHTLTLVLILRLIKVPVVSPFPPPPRLLQATGVTTKAGAWALTDAEASYIEGLADADDRWDALMKGKEEWVNRPLQPPGLGRSGEKRGAREKQQEETGG